jgi:DNA adenine methylase
MRVQIDCRDALDVLRYWDNPRAVFYCDPPYIIETRVNCDEYVSEPDAAFHRQLVEVLLSLQGACVLSGYEHPVYQPLVEAGWMLTRFKTTCHAAGKTRSSGLQGNGSALKKVPRVECVWRNPRAVQMMAGEDRTLFAVAPVQRGSCRARA